VTSKVSENNNVSEEGRASEFVLTPSPRHILQFPLRKSPFPLASKHLRDFLCLADEGKLDALTLIGHGPVERVPILRLCVRSDVSVDAANYKLMIAREALDSVVRDLLVPLNPR
jgi:hypothetical protein